MADMAVHEISRMVGEGSPSGPRKTILPARLIERGSCAAV